MSGSEVFRNLQIAFSGTLSKPVFDFAKIVKQGGGVFHSVVSGKTTHLVTNQADYDSSSVKVRTAQRYGAYIVAEAFIFDSLAAGEKKDEAGYFIGVVQPSDRKWERISTQEPSQAEPSLTSSGDAFGASAMPSTGGFDLRDTAAVIPAPAPAGEPDLAPPNFKIPASFNFKTVRVHKVGPGGPYFPSTYHILRRDILQVTDIKSNNNKYYSMELHTASELGRQYFRIYTHYGRTDDLGKIPNAGQKEQRTFNTLVDAQACYQTIYLEKTGPKKNYRPVHLASANIGSELARGQATAQAAAHAFQQSNAEPRFVSNLEPEVQELVDYIFSEATSALTNAVAARITARGIETPLGILTIQQITKGEELLMQIYELLQHGGAPRASDMAKLEQLSGAFYTVIPHKLGRSKTDMKASVITTLKQFEEKQELLQLMRDMIQVNENGQVLFSSGIDMKYKSLRCEVKPLRHSSASFEDIRRHVIDSQVKSRNIDVMNVYALKREPEYSLFRNSIGNERLLFHGSRVSNFVGLLSRGLLMPKVVTSMGGGRTDAGMLGNGIYFGDASCTSAHYTTAGYRGSRFMLVCRVALGNMCDFTNITKGMNEPPAGYNSVHGVRRTPFQHTDFEDDEYVIFDTRQQRQEFLVEFKLPGDQPRPKPVADGAPSAPTPAPVPAPAPSYPLTPAPAVSAAPAKPHSFGSHAVSSHSAHSPAAHSFGSHTAPAIPQAVLPKPAAALASNAGNISNGPAAGFKDATADQEEKYRRLFAEGSQNSELNNPYLMLIDMDKSHNQFKYEALSGVENNLPMLFTSAPLKASGGVSAVDYKTFAFNFTQFTGGLLQTLEWNGVFAAGGGVLACLDPHFNSNTCSSGDVDLFLYGMTTAQATDKLRHIYTVVSRNAAKSGHPAPQIVRTKHAVTIIGQYPHRHIQIILRLYRSPAEVLMGFDIDCCCVGHDGQKIWALPRAQRAINKQYNLVDLTRRSLTYELRLFKYSRRGYRVAVPGLNRSAIDPNLFTKSTRDVRGLAKLFIYEHKQNQPKPVKGPKTPQARAEAKALRRMKRVALVAGGGPAAFRAAQVANKQPTSDYSDVMIPYGPKWNPFRIMKQLANRDRAVVLAARAVGNTTSHNHIYVAGLQAVLSGISTECSQCSAGTSYDPPADGEDDNFVRGSLGWLSVNPGRQLLTGSFHPVSDDLWYTDAAGGAAGSTTVASTTVAPVTAAPSRYEQYLEKKKEKKAEKSSFGSPSKAVGLFSFASEPEHEEEKEDDAARFSTASGTAAAAASAFVGFEQQKDKEDEAHPGLGFAGGPTSSASSGGGFSFGSTAPSRASGFSFGNAAATPPSSPFVAPALDVQPSTLSGITTSNVTFGNISSSPVKAPKAPTPSVTPAKPVLELAPANDDLAKFGGGSASSSLFFGGDVSSFGGGAPPPGAFSNVTASPSAFGGGRPAQPIASAPTPASFGGPVSSVAGSSFGGDNFAQVFSKAEAPKSPVAKLLLLVSMLFKGGKIQEHEKDKLKSLVIAGDKSLICALEVFEVEKDFEELADTCRRIVKIAA